MEEVSSGGNNARKGRLWNEEKRAREEAGDVSGIGTGGDLRPIVAV